MRKCGNCQLCCFLLPVAEPNVLQKPALQKCKHQRFRKGCSIYEERPFSCRDWSCAWLQGTLPESMRRPDKVGYVVDPIPDTVTYTPENSLDTPVVVPVHQVWLDPRTVTTGSLKLTGGFGLWLDDVFRQGKGILFREGSRKGYVLFEYKGEIIAGEGTLSPTAGQLSEAFSAFVR